MLRLLIVGVACLVAFFPTYWTAHAFLSPNTAAAVAFILAALVYPSLLLNMWTNYPPPFVVPIDRDDPFMDEMIRRSMAEFHRFRDGLTEAKKDALVKYEIKTGEGTTEHVWGIAHSVNDDSVVVSLANAPLEELPGGDELRSTIAIQDLEDWVLIDRDGRTEGGYTHLALVKTYIDVFGKFPKKYRRDLECFVDIDWSEIEGM